MSRAENRFEEWKKKRKTKRILREAWCEPSLAEDEKFVGIEAGVHSRRCSCDMCKRGRKNPWAKGEKKLTLQERKMEEEEKENINERIDQAL